MSYSRFPWNSTAYRKLRTRSNGKKVNHRKIKTIYTRESLQWLVYGLSLKVGDVIQTCRDDFNHRIVKINYKRFTKDWGEDSIIGLIRDIDFFDNYCHGWNDCCSPAKSKEEIVKIYTNDCKRFLNTPFEQNEAFDYVDEEENRRANWQKDYNWYKACNDRLEAGLPICDDDGVIVSELDYKLFYPKSYL